jgi:uncharacterized protein (UPF0332 family)
VTDDIKKDIMEDLKLARETWEEARLNAKEGKYRFSVSHIYYTCFYYLRAILLTKGTAYQTHKGTLIGFRKLFVKEGLAPTELSDFLEKLARDRIEGDYKYAKFTSADVALLTSQAEKFVAFAEDYLAPFLK